MAAIDLAKIVGRMARRDQRRSEADVQSDLKLLLTLAPLELDEGDLEDITLEKQAGGGRRTDVEAGRTVFEVKRNLTVGNVLVDAVEQLTGYVKHRTQEMAQRYVGVLTDGRDWHLYRLDGESLTLVSSITVNPDDPDVDALVVWLEAVLATGSNIKPLPLEIRRRLGADSPGFGLDVAELSDLYDSARSQPDVILKRELWARLLSSALGTNFPNDERLFVAHTYLVLVAELVAHAVVDIDLTDPHLDVNGLMSGAQFQASGIGGVVEPDFFDWPGDVLGGDTFVRSLARRIARFDWSDVEHDVLKVLYESVIDEGTRHRLGEYYTPDWLAQHIVDETVDDPLNQRVLDPSCGSGTFLFWAIRRYLAFADSAGYDNPAAIAGAADHVVGIDLHPVAVTLARVTYLLAIGKKRLQERRSFVVPVYLGDSIQLVEDTSILDAGGITIATTADQQEFWAQQIHFPAEVVADAGRFDALLTDLAERARRSTKQRNPEITAVMHRHQVPPEHRDAVQTAYGILCTLHQAGRNHIWGYYIRNLARPVWLSQSPNRADRLVGNPPWLRFNAMSASMQANFRRLSGERGLSTGGAAVATSRDLAALFVARSIELYLKVGGRFGFVMPASTLSRSQFEGFRSGSYTAPTAPTSVAFGTSWELSGIDPDPFPVPSSVVFGRREKQGRAVALDPEADWWFGHVRNHHRQWNDVRSDITIERRPVAVDDPTKRGYYGDLMRQGSNLVPRVLITVDELPPPAMGLPANMVRVRSHRTTSEKMPWKGLANLEHVVEKRFVRKIHLGETLMPFRLLEPWSAVVPFLDGQVLDLQSVELTAYPGLEQWWRQAESLFVHHRSETTTMTLAEQIDFQSKLTNQYPPAAYRLIYTGRGARVAAAVETDTEVIVDHALYWAPVASHAEGRYLAAILNSDAMHQRTEDYYSKGLLGARNIHKAAFGVPVPEFDPANLDHAAVVELAIEAEAQAMNAVIAGTRTSQNRVAVRAALEEDTLMERLNEAVAAILPKLDA